MKNTKKTNSGKLYTAYRVLLLFLMILMVLIAGGSLISVFRPPEAGPLIQFGGKNAGGAAVSGNNSAETNTGVFSGIGRMRIPVASSGTSSATMILSIAFPFSPDDRPFTEELASKITHFRSITSDYFSSLPASAFITFNEEHAKTELLKRYNAILRLGKIEALYFSDFLILEAE